ncbi:MAG: LPS export ABC transporter permease LptG [Alphaproteobacteria bacterium]
MPITFYKYLGRVFLTWVVLVLLAFSLIVFLVDFMELLRRSGDKADVTISIVLSMTFLKLPNMIQLLMPFTVLFGAMLSFWKLAKSQELIVARAAGISIWQILFPCLLVAVLIGCFNAFVFSPFSAATFSRFGYMEGRYLEGRTSFVSVSQSGLWMRQPYTEGYAVINAKSISEEGSKLFDIAVFVFDDDDEYQFRIDAKTAQLEERRWRLSDVAISKPENSFERLDTYILETELSTSRIQESFAPPESMSFWALSDFVNDLEKSGFPSQQHRLYFNSLLSSPLLLSAMVLIAASFTVRFKGRHQNIAYAFVSGIGTSFFLYFMSDIISAMGLSGRIPIPMAAWTPAFVAVLLGLAALFHLEDG